MSAHTASLVPPAFSIEAPKRPRGRPRKTVGERDDGNRRQTVLEAAAQLFRRKGFSATTTRDIAAAAEMQSGSPFYHFKSKDALLYAVMEEGMHKALARQRDVQHAPGYSRCTPQEQLRHLVAIHFDVLLGVGNDFVPVMLYEWRSLQPKQRKAMRLLGENYEALWMPTLNALHAGGQLRAPAALARLLILGALNWSVQWYNPQKTASLSELTDAALCLFLKES